MGTLEKCECRGRFFGGYLNDQSTYQVGTTCEKYLDTLQVGRSAYWSFDTDLLVILVQGYYVGTLKPPG